MLLLLFVVVVRHGPRKTHWSYGFDPEKWYFIHTAFRFIHNKCDALYSANICVHWLADDVLLLVFFLKENHQLFHPHATHLIIIHFPFLLIQFKFHTIVSWIFDSVYLFIHCTRNNDGDTFVPNRKCAVTKKITAAELVEFFRFSRTKSSFSSHSMD